jgi:hypothetical protein
VRALQVREARHGLLFGGRLAFVRLALDDPNEEHHNRQDDQHVDESTERVGSDQSERPQHHKDDGDGPQHVFTS